jgi:hypothetical protein
VRKEDNPLRVGTFVPHRWRRFRCLSSVAEVFDAVEDNGSLLVPVRYYSGEYAIVVVTEVIGYYGMYFYYRYELPIEGEVGIRALRYSTSPPEILEVRPDGYHIGVTEVEMYLVVDVPRTGSERSLVGAPSTVMLV